MIIERRKNASRNIISGFAFKLFQTLTPFLIRTVMIYKLGMEYVGLDSLFVSILHVLNLAEMGVGSAMVYSMYKPIAADESGKIRSLLNLYKKYYRIIGLIVLLSGLAILPILPKLIKENVPDGLNLYVLYLINLASTVLSYWLFAYRNSLLMAHQRTDKTNIIQLIAYGFRYGLQFVALMVFRSIYLYFMAVLASQFLNNIAILIVTKRLYPDYDPTGSVEPEEKKAINTHIKDLFTAKLGGTITNSADTVVISAFLGLTVLAEYNNYYYVISAIIGFITIILQSCLAGIGNSIVVDSLDKIYNDFKKFSMLMHWVIGYCTVGLFCLLQPFMKIWVHEANMLEDPIAILLCVYFYILEVAVVWATYKDAGGIWHKDRFRPLVVTAVNLSLNLLSVNFFGLYGVIISTLVSYLFVGMPWMLSNVFKYVFKTKPTDYLLREVYYLLVTAAVCVLTYLVCGLIKLENIYGFLIKGVVLTVVSNLLFALAFFKLKEFSEVKRIFTRFLKKKNE